MIIIINYKYYYHWL